MNKREARTILGKLAAQWPHMDQNLQARILQGFTDLERLAVDVLFMRDACPGFPPELPQDEVKPIAETDYPTSDSYSEHRTRWQGVADAGQAELRRKPRKRKAEVVVTPVVESVNEHRQRWTEAVKTPKLLASAKPAPIKDSQIVSPILGHSESGRCWSASA